MHMERRKKRSEIVREALENQLEASATRAGFGSMVLADEQGLIVAAHKPTEELEEVAAISTGLTHAKQLWQGTVRTAFGGLRISVAKVQADFGYLYLCATGGLTSSVEKELVVSGRGVCRILA
ncbi:MAG: hypothetical protein JRI55_25835 [Deltaproteobacteria bacterium]|nr:hypothetical protein [Deltaproteobacteria bacterium]